MHDVFLTTLAKAAFPSRVVAALNEPPQAQRAPRFPISLELLMLSLTGSGRDSRRGRGSGVGPSRCNSACLLALIAAGMFLAGTLGPSWFEVLEVLQKCDFRLYNARYQPAWFDSLGPQLNTGDT